jgi:hypothetical protein
LPTVLLSMPLTHPSLALYWGGAQSIRLASIMLRT